VERFFYMDIFCQPLRVRSHETCRHQLPRSPIIISYIFLSNKIFIHSTLFLLLFFFFIQFAFMTHANFINAQSSFFFLFSELLTPRKYYIFSITQKYTEILLCYATKRIRFINQQLAVVGWIPCMCNIIELLYKCVYF